MSTPKQEAGQRPSPHRIVTQTPPTPASPAVPNSAGSSTSSSSRLPFTPRRSLAHHPRLLGLSENGPIELHGLQSSPKSASSSRHRPPSSRISTPLETPAIILFENAEFANGNVEAGKQAITDEQKAPPSTPIRKEILASALGEGIQVKRKYSHSLAPIRVDSYGGPSGYQIEQDEGSAILSSNRNQTQSQPMMDESRDIEREADSYDYHKSNGDEEDYEVDGLDEQSNRLVFEPTTPREKSWMWISVSLVFVLTIVSIAIAVDWIDWPGDGLGKD